MSDSKKIWVNVRGISAHTGMSEDWFNRDRVTGLCGVPYSRIGRKILYNIELVNEFFLARTVRPGEARGDGRQ